MNSEKYNDVDMKYADPFFRIQGMDIVRRRFTELDPSHKIKTFAVMKVSNAQGDISDEKQNKRVIENFLDAVKHLIIKYLYVEELDNDGEKTVLLFNLTKKEADYLAVQYTKNRYFYGTVTKKQRGSKNYFATIELYGVSSETDRQFELKETSKKIEYITQAATFFKKQGLEHEFNLAHEYFEGNYGRIPEIVEEECLVESLDEGRTFRGRVVSRHCAYSGFPKRKMPSRYCVLEEIKQDAHSCFNIDIKRLPSGDLFNTTWMPGVEKVETLDNVYYVGYMVDGCGRKESRIRREVMNHLTCSIDGINDAFLCSPLNIMVNVFPGVKEEKIDLVLSSRKEEEKLKAKMLEAVDSSLKLKPARADVEDILGFIDECTFKWDKLKEKYTDDTEYNLLKNILNDFVKYFKNKNISSVSPKLKARWKELVNEYIVIPEKYISILKQVKEGNVLVIDNGSLGSYSLEKLIRFLKNINSDCNIYIYTLWEYENI